MNTLGCRTIEVQAIDLWLARNDRVQSSDAFKRAVLASYLNIRPADIYFEKGVHGKPVLMKNTKGIEFNVSHSAEWLACAVSRDVPVGVDLEFCDPRRASLKVARRYFRPEETALLEALPGDQLGQQFFDYWTLKESAVKARGEALAPGLQAYGFRFSGCEAGLLNIDRLPGDDLDQSTYFLLDPVENYRIALCWLGDGRSPAINLLELDCEGAVNTRSVSCRATSTVP